MPIYKYCCWKCKGIVERIQSIGGDGAECCGVPMTKLPTLPAIVRIKGQGFPSRKKWMDDWTPESSGFSTGSHHGERY